MNVEFVDYTAEVLCPLPYMAAVKIIETAGRTCYQSFDKMGVDSWESFIENLIRNGHESVLEHVNYTLQIRCDRGILAEWTRHRIGSAYSVESTRYVQYKDKVQCVAPSQLTNSLADGNKDVAGTVLEVSVERAIQSYRDLLELGVKPQNARAVLPQCLAVNMVVTHNVREWRHILKQRMLNTRAHPDFRRLMVKVCEKLLEVGPIFFRDIGRQMGFQC